MIQFFLAFKFKTMAQCFKNKLINKRETLLEGKRKHIHHMLEKKKKEEEITPSKPESSKSIVSLNLPGST